MQKRTMLGDLMRGNKGQDGAQKPKAFLRWIGGKRLLIHRLLDFLPADIRERTYHEPFVGAASLFFAVTPKKAVLSDLNRHLIESYRHVRDSPSLVAGYLREHLERDSKKHYYNVREIYNRSIFSSAQAARFIYLNHTCFNGIFRVNVKGAFNVPYGDKSNPQIPDTSKLVAISKALKKASLRVSAYEESLATVNADEFVYLAPPYPPLTGTSFFTHYTPDRFSAKDQRSLADCIWELHGRGALFLMTNADLPEIRKLYRGFSIRELRVTRYVSCKGARYKVGELVVCNFQINGSLHRLGKL